MKFLRALFLQNISARFLLSNSLKKVVPKGEFSELRQQKILATESPLKMMKNALYSALKALFVLEIFKFFS